MNRAEIRRVIIDYLEKFYSDFMLYKEQPIVHKLHCKSWAQDMYEQFSDEEKEKLYFKLNFKKNK